MHWSSASSRADDLTDAAEACVASLAAQHPGDPDVVVLFGTQRPGADWARVAATVRGRWPGVALIGCAAAGVVVDGIEIVGNTALSMCAGSLPGVCAATFHLDARALTTAAVSPLTLAHHLGLEEPSVLLLLVDPYSCDPERLLQGLDIACPGAVKLGGLTSGGDAEHQALIADDGVHAGGVVGLALSGAMRLETVVSPGCRPVGPAMRVTRSQGPVLAELDGQPATEALESLFEASAAADQDALKDGLLLGVLVDEAADADSGEAFVVRNVSGADRERGMLMVGTELVAGQRVRFFVRDAAYADEALARRLAASPDDAPRGALLFTCLGRGPRLFEHPDHDAQAFTTRWAAPLCGFFGNGEIGPVAGTSQLHGYTASFALFYPA